MGRLTGKVAIVTGAGSGMGRAMANLFAKEGAKLVVAEWHAETLEEVVAEVKATGAEIVGVQGDVSKDEDCKRTVQAAIDTYGQLDVLCNNAGIMDNMAAAGNFDDAILAKVIGVNSFGPLQMIRAAIPHLLGRNGSIVNSSSLAGIGGGAAGVVYTMSKHAVIGLTLNTAWQYAKQGIRCNAMAIGGVNTKIMENTALGMDPEGGARAGEWAGLAPAFLEPIDVANLALFLASDDSAKVNGAVINVDAGWHSV
jgi:NAD(P)-dependent dehydrogenase (short-subunit alcohol dehydrogenase family)